MGKGKKRKIENNTQEKEIRLRDIDKCRRDIDGQGRISSPSINYIGRKRQEKEKNIYTDMIIRE